MTTIARDVASKMGSGVSFVVLRVLHQKVRFPGFKTYFWAACVLSNLLFNLKGSSTALQT